MVLEGKFLARRTPEGVRLSLVSKSVERGFVAAKDQDPGRNALLLQQGVICPIRIVGIR